MKYKYNIQYTANRAKLSRRRLHISLKRFHVYKVFCHVWNDSACSYHYAILAASKSREYSVDHPRQCRVSGKYVLSDIISVFSRSRTLRREIPWSGDVTHVYASVQNW